MNRFYCFLLIFTIINLNCSAQNDNESKSKSELRYLNMTHLDLLYGSLNGQITNTFSFQSSHNLKFNEHFLLGIGNGIDFHTKNSIALPFYLRAGVIIGKKKVNPIFIQDIGYSISFKRDNNSFYYYTQDKLGHGVYANTFLGVNIKTNKKVAFQIGLEYKLQKLKYDIYVDDWIALPINPQNYITIQRLGIKMGFSI